MGSIIYEEIRLRLYNITDIGSDTLGSQIVFQTAFKGFLRIWLVMKH